jgi:hypothetical protein
LRPKFSTKKIVIPNQEKNARNEKLTHTN